MPISPTVFDDGADGGDLPMNVRVNVLANVAKFIAGTNRVLEHLGISRIHDKEPVFQPYFEVLHQIATERHFEPSGIDALRTFTDSWDTYCRAMQAGLKPHFFSAREIDVLSDSITRFKAWLHRYLPDACEYAYGSNQ